MKFQEKILEGNFPRKSVVNRIFAKVFANKEVRPKI